MNVLHIITLLNYLKYDSNLDIVSYTFIFGDKATPEYFMSQPII
ncbi:MAG: glycogen/starch/alpha-glucan phosphorylase [cyanobacterium endosymbiont of Rhopalodia yunnanensis]